MKHIVETFSALVLIILMSFVSIAILTASAQVTNAKGYKADCIAEIENSNFNSAVISDCVTKAAAAGYELQVKSCSYDIYNDINTAEVILTYQYEIPLFGVSVTKTTRGIAR